VGHHAGVDAYEMAVSHRAADAVRDGLQGWLQARHEGAEVVELRRPEGNGMSSETLLFDASWEGAVHHLVARVAPPPEDVPVFREYDLAMQFRVMRLVAERSDTPVPACLWLEEDPSVLGTPFFVMERVLGRVPKDNLPYTFEGWVVDATEAERIAMQDDTVWATAGIHGVDLSDVDPTLLGHDPVGPCALRQQVGSWRDYYRWLDLDAPLPVIEDTFDWLDAHWPDDDGGPAVLSWGDARIGNVIYDGFRPAAVLDWEMAGLAPRGVDLGWMAYLHEFFQDVAEQLGLPGLPGFLRLDDIVESYQARTGVRVTDGEFWRVYAGLRYGLIMARIHQRQLAFGEVEPSSDPEAGVMHRDWLRRMTGS
jgi:aminoglycoside phosphotransferase (APT) family kinase protein